MVEHTRLEADRMHESLNTSVQLFKQFIFQSSRPATVSPGYGASCTSAGRLSCCSLPGIVSIEFGWFFIFLSFIYMNVTFLNVLFCLIPSIMFMLYRGVSDRYILLVSSWDIINTLSCCFDSFQQSKLLQLFLACSIMSCTVSSSFPRTPSVCICSCKFCHWEWTFTKHLTS